MNEQLEDLARRLDELNADQAARLSAYLRRGEEPPAGAPAPTTPRGPRDPEPLEAVAELAS